MGGRRAAREQYCVMPTKIAHTNLPNVLRQAKLRTCACEPQPVRTLDLYY